MVSRLRLFWQQMREHWVIVIIAALVVVTALIVTGYILNWDWLGLNGYNKVTIATDFSSSPPKITRTEEYQPGKTLWDWLQLLGVLAIPIVVGFGVALFNSMQSEVEAKRAAQRDKESEKSRNQQHQTDLQIAEEDRKSRQQTQIEIARESRQEAALQNYLEAVSDIILTKATRIEGELRFERPENIGWTAIIQARTLTILRDLDAKRKGNVLQFLHESRLLGLIDLSKADLREANLIFANLSNDHLSHLHLDYADLSGADISGTDLSRADLSGANLSGANLSSTDLSYANLKGATVIPKQLAKVGSLKGATMPDGSKHP